MNSADPKGLFIDRAVRNARQVADMQQDDSSIRKAFAFVEEHGVVLESGRGPVPSLADAIAGELIRGSWWGHQKGRDIFRATRAIRDSSDVLVCRLIDGKITFVHRRLWPALVRLADRLEPGTLIAIREKHTASGAHKLVTTPFPRWVPVTIREAARKMSETEARNSFGDWLPISHRRKTARSR